MKKRNYRAQKVNEIRWEDMILTTAMAQTIRTPSCVTLAVFAVLALFAHSPADADSGSASPPCSDPDGVAFNLATQIVRMGQTPEGRAALAPIIGAAGNIIATAVFPQSVASKLAVQTITGVAVTGVTVWNANVAQREIYQSTRVVMNSLTPPQQDAFAQRLSQHFSPALSALHLGGICLEQPRFRVVPDAKERFERARQEAIQ